LTYLRCQLTLLTDSPTRKMVSRFKQIKVRHQARLATLGQVPSTLKHHRYAY
jgi:hypothetical protein